MTVQHVGGADLRVGGRWLIVGCGYVGTALGRTLVAHGAARDVVGVRRHAPDTSEALPFACVAADCHADDFTKALPDGDFDTVVYCAAAKSSEPAAYEHTYVGGAQHLVAAMQKRQRTPARLLFTSSTAVFDANDGRAVDEATVCNPTNFRGATMRRAEQVFLSCGWPAVVLRLGGIYGPGRTSSLRRIAGGKTLLTRTPVYQNRIHRDDCAGALMHLGLAPAPDALYVGVDCAPDARNDVVRWVCQALDQTLPAVGDDASQPGKRCVNARLVQSGYAFAYPSYREGYTALLGELVP